MSFLALSGGLSDGCEVCSRSVGTKEPRVIMKSALRLRLRLRYSASTMSARKEPYERSI